MRDEETTRKPGAAHSMDTGDWVSQKDVTRFPTVLQLGQYKQADFVAFKVPIKTNQNNICASLIMWGNIDEI